MEVKMNMFIPISKFDEEQRMVYGIATCSKLDNQNEIIDWAATKEAVKDYSQWRNIREMHKPSAVGVAPLLELRDDTEELHIGAKIVDDAAWAKCKEGVYKGFSIGGDKLDQKVELDKASHKTVNRVTKYMLNEISLVDRPANPACKFSTVKRDTSVHVITTAEDPLKGESARVMEKALLIAKKTLTKGELEALPDADFGLITVTADGDTLIKKRDYPMPDKVHAINMIRKSAGDPISDIDKERVHQTALLVLGKKHVETECPYCISKLKGGVVVDTKMKKAGSVVVTHEPNKKTVVVEGDAHEKAEAAGKPVAEVGNEKPVEEGKVEGKVGVKEDEAPVAGVAEAAPNPEAAPEQNVSSGLEAKIDRVLTLLEGALGGAEEAPVEEEEAPVDETTYEEEAPADIAPAEEAPEVPVGEKEKKKEAVGVAECIKVAAPKEVAKAEGPKVNVVVKPLAKALLSKQLQNVIEPLVKENKELKARIEKIEKQPLPRKEAKEGDRPVKVEKYQDVKLEKKEGTFSEELQKEVTAAQELVKMKGVQNLTKDEKAFCERVADKMLAEKLSK
jgi:hypothetical protein